MKSSSSSRRAFLKTTASLPWLVASASAAQSAGIKRPASPVSPTNASIQAFRNIALSMLKPSARDLAYGMELHAQSVVFESYGFSPRTAIDGEAFAAEIRAGASESELDDLLEDMTQTRCVTSETERREYLEAFRASGVTCVFQNAGESGNDPARLIKRLALFTYVTDSLRPIVAKAVSADDIVKAKQDGNMCLCFTTNGVPLRQEWDSTRDELREIRKFRQLGVRMMHVTYNRRNPIGDGVGEPNDGGLSDFGRKVVAELNLRGVIADVSHSGWRTSLDTAKASTRPMVASHTTCAGLYHHFRGKPDEVIAAICGTGGLVGICGIPHYLGKDGDITTFLNHIDYAVRRFGSEHVAIGVDKGYRSRNHGIEMSKARAARPNRERDQWEKLWPEEHPVGKPHAWQSLAWTNWPLFTVGMVQRGHSDETIRRILGGNMLRVLRANSG